MRLIDADALCEEFKRRQVAALNWKECAILDGDEERKIRADATLAFLTEVKLTIDKAPTFEDRDLYNMGYFDGKKVALNSLYGAAATLIIGKRPKEEKKDDTTRETDLPEGDNS